MREDIETDVLSGLIRDEDYARVVMPHVIPDYFQDAACRTVFGLIAEHFEKYKKMPVRKELSSTLRDKVGSMRDELISQSGVRLAELDLTTKVDTKWLTDRTEKFCKDRAVYNAVALASAITSGEEKKLAQDSIPELLRSALAVSFDTRVGHDYFEDAESRWIGYTQDVPRIKFRVRGFNEISRGGLPNKTLTVPLAGCVHPATRIKIRRRVLPFQESIHQQRTDRQTV